MSYLDELDREIARLKDSLEALETLRIELQGYPALVDVRIHDLVDRILAREFYVKHAMLHEPGMPDEVWRPAGGVEFDAIVDPRNRLIGASNTPRFRTMTEAVNFGAKYGTTSVWTILLADDIEEEALVTESPVYARHLVVVGIRGGGHYPTERFTGTTDIRHARPTWRAPDGKHCFKAAILGWQSLTLENLWLTNRQNSSFAELLWLPGDGIPLFIFRTILEQSSTTLPHWRSQNLSRMLSGGSVWIESTFLGGSVIYLRGSTSIQRYLLYRNLIKTPLSGMDGTISNLIMNGNIVSANTTNPLLQVQSVSDFIITNNLFRQDNASGGGLRLESNSPVQVITGNRIFCSNANSTGSGLFVGYQKASLDPPPDPGVTIAGNLISGFANGIELNTAANRRLLAAINGNQIMAKSVGIKLVTNFLAGFGSIIDAIVSGNTILNTPTGLEFTVATNSSIQGCFEPNLFMNVTTPVSGSPTRSELVSNFADILSTAEPPTPPAGYVRLFYNSATGALSVKKPDGTVVNLEA